MLNHIYLANINRLSDFCSRMSDQEADILCDVPSLSDCIFTAVHTGNIEEIQRLINLGCNVNVSDSGVRWKSTHAACCYNQPEILKLLLKAGGVLNDKSSSGLKASPLIYALEHKHEECVRVLIEYGADVNTRNYRRESVISLLAHFCLDIELFKDIIRRGHKVNDIIVEGDILSHVPYNEQSFRIELTSLLERAGAFTIRRFVQDSNDKRDRRCPERLEKGCVDIIRKLLLKMNSNSNLYVITKKLSVPPGVLSLLTEGLCNEI